MRDKLKELIQQGAKGHTLMPTESIVDYLLENGVIVPPSKIGDTVYYIGGIHGKLIKPARVDEIYFNGCAFGLGLVSENNVYFDMPADKVYFTKKAAEEACNELNKGD